MDNKQQSNLAFDLLNKAIDNLDDSHFFAFVLVAVDKVCEGRGWCAKDFMEAYLSIKKEAEQRDGKA